MSKRAPWEYDFDAHDGQMAPTHAPWELTNPTGALARAYDRFLDAVIDTDIDPLPGIRDYNGGDYSRVLDGDVWVDGAGYDKAFGFASIAEAEAWQKREAAKPRRFLDRDWKAPTRKRKRTNKALVDYRTRLVSHARFIGRPFYPSDIIAAMGRPPHGTFSAMIDYLEKRGVLRRTGNSRPRTHRWPETEWILRELYDAQRRTA